MNGNNYSLTARTYGVDKKWIKEWEKVHDKLALLCYTKIKKRKLQEGSLQNLQSDLCNLISKYFRQRK